MDISEKRLAANRANAAKSTGPKTVAGRFNSSRNATKHGFLAKAILIDGESPEHFNELLRSIIQEFQPETPTGHSLVEIMAVAKWRILRLWTMDSADLIHEMRGQPDAVTAESYPTRAAIALRSLSENSTHSEAMNRYEHRLVRQYHSALRMLLALKEQKSEKNTKRSHRLDENKEDIQ